MNFLTIGFLAGVAAFLGGAVSQFLHEKRRHKERIKKAQEWIKYQKSYYVRAVDVAGNSHDGRIFVPMVVNTETYSAYEMCLEVINGDRRFVTRDNAIIPHGQISSYYIMEVENVE